MNILHVIPSISKKSGGPATSVLFAAELLSSNHEVEICSTKEDLTDAEIDTFYQEKRFKVHLFDYKSRHSTKYSVELFRFLISKLNVVHSVHIHAGFSLISQISALLCILFKQKFVYRPLGTLSPYSLTVGNQKMKKWMLPLEKFILKQANSVQATSEQEKKDLIALVDVEHIEIIPPIGIADTSSTEKTGNRKPVQLGFLSRIHTKKNLEFLFQIVSKLKNEEWYLRIGGEGDSDYIESLNKLAHELGISERIEFVGFIKDEMKPAFFASVDWFVLPSLHENFGISMVEALSHSVPCIVSNSVDAAQFVVQDNQPGSEFVFRLPLTESDWILTLQLIVKDSDEAYQKRTIEARNQARKKFSKESVLKKLEQLYLA
ncbi:glycosyltransferase [bacterium]|nr:MAG: glycosyltransferase [bacterium]